MPVVGRSRSSRLLPRIRRQIWTIDSDSFVARRRPIVNGSATPGGGAAGSCRRRRYRATGPRKLATGLPQTRNQLLNLILLVLGRIVLQRFLKLIERPRFIALLRVCHPQVETISRVVRLFGYQILEDFDGVVRQVLLQVDPAEGVGDLKETGQQLLGALRFGERVVQRSEERRVGKECRSRWSPYH